MQFTGIKALQYFTLVLLFFAINCEAQARRFDEFQVTHYGDESLPQTSISEILGDKKGFLWIGTQMGLVRFDGQTFRVFSPDNTPQMKTVRTLRLHKDRAGNLYFEDANANIYRVSHNGLQMIPEDSVDRMHGRIYIPGKISPFQETSSTGDKTFYFTSTFHDQTIVYTYARNRDTVRYSLPGLSNLNEPCFIIGRTIYVVNADFSITALCPGAPLKQDIHFSGDLLSDPLYVKQKGYQNAVVFERPGAAFYLLGNNMYRLEEKNGSIYTTQVIADIPVQDIHAFYADSVNGYYAIGSTSTGLYILRPKHFSVKTLRAGNDASVFYAIEHISDKLFFSSKGYLFDLYKEFEKKISDNLSMFGLYRMPDHILTSRGDTLFRLDLQTLSVKKYSASNGWLIQGLQDKSGRTWLATYNTVGQLVNDSVKWLSLNLRDKSNNYRGIESICIPHRDTLLIALRDGMVAVDLRAGKSYELPLMKGLYVRHLQTDVFGGIWILTYGNGYYYYRDGKLTALPLDKNQNLKTVHTLLPDKNGYFWMSCNKGLFRVSSAALYRYIQDHENPVYYEYFDKRAGFITNEFNGGCHPAGYIVSDSLMLLPSMAGLVYFNPLSIPAAPLQQLIYTDRVMIDGVPQPLDGSYAAPARFSVFYCEVASPYFGSNDNMRLEYRIDEIMDNWLPLTDNRYFQFNRLPYGNYHIRVRKVVSLLTGATTELTIRFQVAPPWYMKTWFLLTCLLLLIGLVWLIIAIRLRIVHAQKARLTQQVNERTRQLATSLDQLKHTVQTLEQSQAELYKSNRFKEQLTSLVLHDIQAPLRFLKRFAMYVWEKHPGLPAQKLKTDLEALYYATAEVMAYSEDFLTWIKSQKGNFSVRMGEIQLRTVFEEICNLYQKIATDQGASLHIDCPGNLLIQSDPALLSIVIRNLTDNAIKYAPKGNITLIGRRQRSRVEIIVKDTGKGMSQEEIDNIVMPGDAEVITAGGKFGYLLIRDMLLLLNGTLHINSVPAGGTEVIVTFNQ